MANRSDLVLPPSEFSGESGTFVGGRVVSVRITKLQVEPKTKAGKGKSKGKKTESKGSRGTEELMKCEVHILGGLSTAEVLYLEAWGETVVQRVEESAIKQHLVKIKDVKIVSLRPQYSTSRLSYYLRAQASTKIESFQDAGEPWSNIPMHHPFVEIGVLKRVDDELQACMLGIVSRQPGAVMRTTQYGDAKVCNATLRLKQATIRTSLWRTLAEKMAGFI